MINFDYYVNENKTVHNKNWPYIADHSFRIIIIGGLRSGKTNAINLMVLIVLMIFRIILNSLLKNKKL